MLGLLKLSRRFLCSFHAPIQNPALGKLCEVVNGVGGLDDMEAALDQSVVEMADIVTPSLVSQVVDFASQSDPPPSRRLVRFFSWARQRNPELEEWNQVFNQSIRVLAKKRDFTGVDILISDFQKERRIMETSTFCCLAEALVKSGRADDALGIFKNLNKFGCPRDATAVSAIVHALCSRGHARKAQGVLWHHRLKRSLPVEPCLYTALLHGWCNHGNVKEARAVLEDIKSRGLSPCLPAYNAFLRCLCTRNLKFNPSALVSEASTVMAEMRSQCITPTSASFNILLSCLSKVRRVKEACRVLEQMRGGGCCPDWMSYYLVARVLYLTGRMGSGDRVADDMVADGLAPEPRFYHGLVALLCGIDKVSHALGMLERMKKNLQCPVEARGSVYGPVYDLVIFKLCRRGEFDKGRQLWDEATGNGFQLECLSDVLNSLKTKGELNPEEVITPCKMEKANWGEYKRLAQKGEHKFRVRNGKKRVKRLPAA